MAHVIDSSHQQQISSDSNQNSNGDNKSRVPTGEGTPEKFVPITVLLEMVASRLGVLVCGWAMAMLVQGGMVFPLETKDRVFVTVMFFLVCFHYWRYFCPQATGSLTEATQSLSTNNSSIANDIQQLVLPMGLISRLFHWCKLVSALTSVVLSMMQLTSHDFGQTERANKASRDFALKVFYVFALAEAMVLPFALTLVMTIINGRNSYWSGKWEPSPVREKMTEEVLKRK